MVKRVIHVGWVFRTFIGARAMVSFGMNRGQGI